jgi:hypothetical protein
MAGPEGLYASRYASSTNPLGSFQSRQSTIRDRLAQLKLAKSTSEKEQSAHEDAINLAVEEAVTKRAEEQRGLEQAKLATQADRREEELARKEAEEANDRDSARVAIKKEQALLESARVAKAKAESDRIIREEAEAQRQRNEATARIATARQGLVKLTTQLSEVKTAEQARKAAREKAGMAALADLAGADARVKEVAQDRFEISKLVEESTAELAVAQKRLGELEKKSSAIDELISEAQKGLDTINKTINTMEATNKIEREVYEKDCVKLRKEMESLQQVVACATSGEVSSTIS